MSDDGSLYSALLVIFGVVAVGAVVMGSAGLYVVLTGGTTDGDVEVDVLGEFGCEEFDADLEMPHDPGYDVERTILDGRQIDAFEPEAAGGGYRFNITVAGELINASARRTDGSALSVDRDANRLVVETNSSASFRLWIDTITETTSVARTRLDICPPG
jgi:hypothetical protein